MTGPGLIDGLLWLMAAAVLAPIAALALETAAAVMPRRRGAPPDAAPRPRAAVLIPAHNEELLIGQTLQSIQPTLAPGDVVLVVADNCDDRTADVARAAGARVVERCDAAQRGKGYALDFGLRALAADPPEVVIVVDADCLVSPPTVEVLARTAARSGRPVQSLNLTDRRAAAGPFQAVCTLANRFTNLIRPLGLLRLGLPCRLMGTGMAIPWALVDRIRPTGANLVEDLQLGIDLAIQGHLPLFCPEARVSSALPAEEHAFVSQRTRWEHGHLRTAATQIPRLLYAAVIRRSPRLLALAWDLSIPPMTLLAGAWLVVGVGLCRAGLCGAAWLPAAAVALGGALLAATIGLGWAAFCREQVPLTVLAAVPAYLVRKLPIYAGLLIRRPRTWVRTERVPLREDAASPEPPAEEAQRFQVLGVEILNLSRAQGVAILEAVLRRRERRPHNVFFVNAHTLNLAAADRSFRAVLAAADYVFADGTGVRWAARLQGVRVRGNLVGTDFTPALLRSGAGCGYSYFLLGSDPNTVAAAAAYAESTFPGWRMAGFHHGYLAGDEATAQVVEQINAAQPDVLLVGMGNPLQERWLHAQRDRLRVPVCLAIGGLFDYWAGNVSRAPQWLRHAGHEWLWRLFQQPRQKACRYLVGNPLFLARILGERWRRPK